MREILAGHVEPKMGVIASTYDAARRRLAGEIEIGLNALLPGSRDTGDERTPGERRGGATLFAPKRAARAEAAAPINAGAAQDLIAQWDRTARAPATRRAGPPAARWPGSVSALVVRHGRVWGNRELMASLALDLACNDYASAGDRPRRSIRGCAAPRRHRAIACCRRRRSPS